MKNSSWGYSSGSEDGSEIYELEESVDVPQRLQSEYEAGTTLYPIKMRDRGSTYASVLYDVEGNPLKNMTGDFLNVRTSAMKSAFDEGSLRLIHCMKEPGYRYFVTSKSQEENFKIHRDVGATRKVTYHVYVDEDVDRNSWSYRNSFVHSKPIKVKTK